MYSSNLANVNNCAVMSDILSKDCGDLRVDGKFEKSNIVFSKNVPEQVEP